MRGFEEGAKSFRGWDEGAIEKRKVKVEELGKKLSVNFYIEYTFSKERNQEKDAKGVCGLLIEA